MSESWSLFLDEFRAVPVLVVEQTALGPLLPALRRGTRVEFLLNNRILIYDYGVQAKELDGGQDEIMVALELSDIGAAVIASRLKELAKSCSSSASSSSSLRKCGEEEKEEGQEETSDISLIANEALLNAGPLPSVLDSYIRQGKVKLETFLPTAPPRGHRGQYRRPLSVTFTPRSLLPCDKVEERFLQMPERCFPFYQTQSLSSSFSSLPSFAPSSPSPPSFSSLSPPTSAASRFTCRRPVASFRYVELFAGIGGFRLGLDKAGGECVFVNEVGPLFARFVP